MGVQEVLETDFGWSMPHLSSAGMSFFQFVRFLVCWIFILPCIAWSFNCFAGMSDREPEGSGSVPESVHDASLQVFDCVFVFVLWLSWPACVFVFRLHPPVRASSDLTFLQVLAGEARSGEGAWLPLQDHDLRPQPADQQLLTARLVLLENHQSTVWWRKRCLRENDTWDYPLARKLWWVEENGPKIDTEYIYILLIDWPNPLMVDRSIPIFI